MLTSAYASVNSGIFGMTFSNVPSIAGIIYVVFILKKSSPEPAD
jgi:hypothetical protein